MSDDLGRFKAWRRLFFTHLGVESVVELMCLTCPFFFEGECRYKDFQDYRAELVSMVYFDGSFEHIYWLRKGLDGEMFLSVLALIPKSISLSELQSFLRLIEQLEKLFSVNESRISFHHYLGGRKVRFLVYLWILK